MKKIVLIILACLLVGSVLAFLANYLIYTPILESYAVKSNNQQAEISRLVQFNRDLEQTLANQESLISSQQIQISSLQDEITTQKATIINQESRISTLETEKSNLQVELEKAETTISYLEGELFDKKSE